VKPVLVVLDVPQTTLPSSSAALLLPDHSNLTFVLITGKVLGLHKLLKIIHITLPHFKLHRICYSQGLIISFSCELTNLKLSALPSIKKEM
jgi:uncharacterized membrane protein